MNSKFSSLLFIGLGVIVAGLLFSPQEAPARPEIAALQNSPCAKCHVNPMGGGQRNATGFFVSKELALEASTKAIDENFKDFGEFVPAIGDHFLFGADLRPMWHDIEDDSDIPDDQEGPNSSTFYMMQAAFHVDAHLLPILHITGSYDVAQNTFEAYGLIDELPAGLYFKIGRFIVPYGIRMDDHTIFTRQPLGFHAVNQDTGLELGVRPGPFFLAAAVTNGNLGNQAQDRDGDYYAVTGQTGIRFWKIGLGGSYFHNTVQDMYRHVYGPWATFGIWKISVLGEFDMYNQEENLGTDVDPRYRVRIGSAGFGMLDVEIIRGLNIQARYSHQDTNWERDETYQDQIMGGILFYPIPYLSTTFQFRYNREPEDVEQDNNELLIQAHLFF